MMIRSCPAILSLVKGPGSGWEWETKDVQESATDLVPRTWSAF